MDSKITFVCVYNDLCQLQDMLLKSLALQINHLIKYGG